MGVAVGYRAGRVQGDDIGDHLTSILCPFCVNNNDSQQHATEGVLS